MHFYTQSVGNTIVNVNIKHLTLASNLFDLTDFATYLETFFLLSKFWLRLCLVT